MGKEPRANLIVFETAVEPVCEHKGAEVVELEHLLSDVCTSAKPCQEQNSPVFQCGSPVVRVQRRPEVRIPCISYAT